MEIFNPADRPSDTKADSSSQQERRRRPRRQQKQPHHPTTGITARPRQSQAGAGDAPPTATAAEAAPTRDMCDLKRIQAEFLTVREARERDLARMTAQLRTLRQRYDTTRIENMMVFGIGTLAGGDDTGVRQDWLRRVATIWALAQQLGLQRQALSMLTESTSVTICTGPGQENLPQAKNETNLSIMEVEFLKSIGFTCVDEKQAYASINEQTLVYAAGAEPWIFKQLSMGAWPAAVVSEDIDRVIRTSRLRGAPYTHSQKTDVRGMIQGCEGQPFAASAGDNDETRELLYWRRSPVNAMHRSQRNSAERFLEFVSTSEPSPEEDLDVAKDLTPNSADKFFRSVILNPPDFGRSSQQIREHSQPTSPLAKSPGKERAMNLGNLDEEKS
ncbi:hypothetical protein PVAG01_08286 [Phlyctema vagabunda]|uniref:SRR1-like domain-containing protein n=1 Tax=Phlyctema vagabunda TaxID=108571 RepID=A0ABR4P8Z0_9HELO